MLKLAKMTEKSETGKLGEDIACKYLVQKGYRILERNHRQKWGEIDIVAMDHNGALALVEVKTVGGYDPYISPEDQMTHSKIEKFKRAAYLYANNYFKKRDDSKGWRLDLIGINLNGNPSSSSGQVRCRLKHYKNIA